jgi:shikimate 5-dehydrogenase
MKLPEKAAHPTMYFIGVTTSQSSIMKLFPLWAEALGIDARIRGIDIGIDADPEVYRNVVEFIKNDELSMGALVTTHKINLYQAARDLFDWLDPYARMFGELSCISKRDGRLEGHAKDPITSGLALEAFVPENHWRRHEGEALIMGAGGAAIAMGAYLLHERHGDNVPSRLVVTDLSEQRLDEFARIMKSINPDVPLELHLTPEPEMNDALLKGLKPHSLVVNATGLGKDRPGSPLTDACEFPEGGLVWEINYRGDLLFMHQALRQKEARNLHVEDGWVYFLHGWTQVIAEVFHLDMTPERFRECARIADRIR